MGDAGEQKRVRKGEVDDDTARQTRKKEERQAMRGASRPRIPPDPLRPARRREFCSGDGAAEASRSR
ncbi:unnamed protein product [Lampetra fluviatilis]